jgi:hypothetical protein
MVAPLLFGWTAIDNRRTNLELMRFIASEAGQVRRVGSRDWKLSMSDSVTTTNHETIRKWAEERGGQPATVRATEDDGHAGILRIDFDPRQKALEQIEWSEFFRKFDESDLAFLYQDRTKDGKLSRFHKFVHRSSVQ